MLWSIYHWKLEPSICRGGVSEYEQFKDEQISDKEFVKRIAKYQHYGRKTRLLDFTSDINIALFFACNEDFNNDTALYIKRYSPRKMFWIDPKIILELIKLQGEIALLEFARHVFGKHDNVKEKIEDERSLASYISSWIGGGIMVLPSDEDYSDLKEENKRIVRQQGGFFIFGNEIIGKSKSTRDVENVTILPCISKTEPPSYSGYTNNTKIRIPASLKEVILHELDKIGINKTELMCE